MYILVKYIQESIRNIIPNALGEVIAAQNYSIFEACNITAKAFQENMREVWERAGIEITIDTWPGLKPFIEIEGLSETAVRETSQELGFNFTDAVFGSIDLVYEKEIGIPAATIIQLPEITFENPPKKNAA